MITFKKCHPRYPKYKPSNTNAIGNIPDGWEVKKLKYMASVCNGSDYKDIEAEDGEYPVYGSGGEFARANAFVYNKPSVLLWRKGTIDKPLFVTEPFWTVDTMFYTKIFGNTYPKFFYYLCLGINFSEHQSGSAIPSMTQWILANISFPTPELEEQIVIVTYLDEKAALLDESIAKKRQQIDLLSEHRSALINNAITKGLDPNVEMKDSGIEWIGMIPKEWEVKKLKYAAPNTNQKTTFSGDLFSVAMENIESWTGKYLPIDGERTFESNMNSFEQGDVLFGKLRPYLAKAYKAACSGLCVGEFLVLRPSSEITQDYLFYRIVSSDFITQVNNSTLGTKMPRADWEFIGNLAMGIPPIAEQKEIVDYLEKETAYIDSMKSKIEQSIELLQEYKTSLISHAVSGKIKP